jgi:exopolysaccharide biosynthesis polyprenyl glycosylphosphotransferase
MGRSRRRLLMGAFKLGDVCLCMTSFGLATIPILRGSMSLTRFFSLRISIRNLAVFTAFLILWHLIFIALGLYQSKRLSSRTAEMYDLLRATVLGTACLGVAGLLFGIRMLHPIFLLWFWVIISALTITSRLLLRTALKIIRRHNRNLRRMLVVGSNPRALAFARKVQSRPELGYEVIGFADEPWAGRQDFGKTDERILCDLEGLPNFLCQNVVDEVVIGLPLKSCYQQASRIATACEEQGIILRFPLTIFDFKIARSQAEDFDGNPFITVFTGVHEGASTWAKRVLDIVFSAALILLFAPLVGLAALLIKLTSPGPLFFVQQRLGLNKRLFSMYKLRTMVVGADERQVELEHLNEADGPVFKIKKDPRITAVGRLLRKTSIDELPQLFNVLKGDMSLVGPRPLPWRDYQGFDKDWQRRRFSVRPGITCLWQINGRSSAPFEKWMQLDMEYIDGWSLWLDVKILFMTIPAVLRGVGAA